MTAARSLHVAVALVHAPSPGTASSASTVLSTIKVAALSDRGASALELRVPAATLRWGPRNAV